MDYSVLTWGSSDAGGYSGAERAQLSEGVRGCPRAYKPYNDYKALQGVAVTFSDNAAKTPVQIYSRVNRQFGFTALILATAIWMSAPRRREGCCLR